MTELHSRQRHLVAVADGDLHLQLACFLVDEQDAERAVVDHAAGEIGNARQELVEIEDGAELAADLGERLERAGVFALVLEEPRVLDGNSDMGAELPQY